MKVNKNGKKIYMWKRKHVSEKIYFQRLSQQKNGQNRRNNNVHNLEDIMPGRRFINFGVLCKKFHCSFCKKGLLIENITEEKHFGLASVLTVKCNDCLTLTNVATDEKHLAKTGKEHYNINTEAALGILHAGMGTTHLNKFLACVNVPPVESKLLKRHEREIGPVIENIATESCTKWAEIERDLTIQNENKIKSLLPQDLQTGFIIKKAKLNNPTSGLNEDHYRNDAILVSQDNFEVIQDNEKNMEISKNISSVTEYRTEGSEDQSQSAIPVIKNVNAIQDNNNNIEIQKSMLFAQKRVTERSKDYPCSMIFENGHLSVIQENKENMEIWENIPCAREYETEESEDYCQSAISVIENSSTIQDNNNHMKIQNLSFAQEHVTELSEDHPCSPTSVIENINEIQENEMRMKIRENILCEKTDVTFDDVVRIIVSYDMGWSTRGTGRSYDSLFGHGSIIGLHTGRVLQYTTRSRKCRMCDKGHPVDDHDCRKNFIGSAKAMEPSAAVEAVTQSSILKKLNLEVGILIGDDDSSTIAAVRNSSDHQVIKHSDKNHTTKGVSKELYKIQKNCKEMTREAIDYLKRCFTYAVEQNKNQTAAMAEAIENIPFHCFNQHKKCGEWCRFKKNPENYKPHKYFQNLDLFEDLKILFNKLAANVNRFASGASSQANESLNAIMASKAPKSRCYSLSESANFRYACAVNQKNLGEQYIITVKDQLRLKTGKHVDKHVQNMDEKARNRKLYAKTRQFKKRRLFLKKNKTMLRNRKETIEGTSYSAGMGLLDSEAMEIDFVKINKINLNLSPCIVFFDLETSSFSMTADILQIAAKWKDHTFSAYINPKQRIVPEATNANNLTNENGNLMLNGVQVQSKPRKMVLQEFLAFLSNLGRKSILCAHNCAFDSRRLIKAINCELIDKQFGSIISGFVDTLSIVRRVTKKKGKGENSLVNVAKRLDISTDGAHNAINDVLMLEKIVEKLNITEEELISNCKNWNIFIENEIQERKCKPTLKTLECLKACVSLAMRKRMATANISYNTLIETYQNHQISGIKLLLGLDENKKIRVTKSSRVLNPLLEYLKKNVAKN